MEIKYNNKPLKYEEFLLPSQTETVPQVKIEDLGYKYYTLIMYDPDAVSGNHWHWVVMNAKNGNVDPKKSFLEYMGPAPPDNKIHRYIFELYGSNNKYEYTKNEKDFFKKRNISLKEGKQQLHLDGMPIIQSFFLSAREKKGGRFKNRNTYKKKVKKRETKTRRKRY
jgi:phosphatidylethanolamine-binding protein (PEBP) family uncharacterized protein